MGSFWEALPGGPLPIAGNNEIVAVYRLDGVMHACATFWNGFSWNVQQYRLNWLNGAGVAHRILLSIFYGCTRRGLMVQAIIAAITRC